MRRAYSPLRLNNFGPDALPVKSISSSLYLSIQSLFSISAASSSHPLLAQTAAPPRLHNISLLSFTSLPPGREGIRRRFSVLPCLPSAASSNKIIIHRRPMRKYQNIDVFLDILRVWKQSREKRLCRFISGRAGAVPLPVTGRRW